jgi:hypothetical protein
VRSKFFFLIGDKSILLAQEMIPGEVFRKVSLKSNFNLFNDSRNVLFFILLFFLSGDKSILLDKEMIPGEISRKVYFKYYFYLFDGYVFLSNELFLLKFFSDWR